MDTRQYRDTTEATIIGAILLDNSQYTPVLGVINADDFENLLYRKIFLGINGLMESKNSCDLLLLEGLLQPEMPALNIFSILADLSRNTYCATNAVLYAEQLRDLNTRQELSQSLNEISKANLEGNPLPDILERAQAQMLTLSTQTNTAQKFINISQIVGSVLSEIEACEDDKKPLKLMTGYNKIDELLQGFRPGQLIILGARPSMGKTTLALNIVHNILQQQQRVLFCSFEMSQLEVGRILMAISGSIPLPALKDETILHNESLCSRLAASVARLNSVKFGMIEEGSTIGKLKSAIRDYKQKNSDLNFVVIDYLGLLTKPKSENRVMEISAITRELKLLARELSVPILVLSQLNREAAEKPPQLSNLRESGSIEQDADTVIFIQREERNAKIIIAKNRSGACGELQLEFNGITATFMEAKDGFSSNSNCM